MFNILTDILPKEYEGYLINYQYYNGILITECLSDEENLFSNDDMGKMEKLYTAFTILYGNGIPDIDTALDGLNWFMSCGNNVQDNDKKEKEEEFFSFSQDSAYIYSAFRVKYNINLAIEKDLHWFEFIYLFNDLSKTAFREIVNIRMMTPKDLKNYSKETRAEILKQKQKFALNKNINKNYSKEELDKINKFYDLINSKK